MMWSDVWDPVPVCAEVTGSHCTQTSLETQDELLNGFSQYHDYSPIRANRTVEPRADDILHAADKKICEL